MIGMDDYFVKHYYGRGHALKESAARIDQKPNAKFFAVFGPFVAP